MPNISKLPSYVLETILLYSADIRSSYLDGWKKRIPLVGVCKKWTSILRPVVFSTAYLYYYSYNGNEGWVTNIDFIAIRGWYSSVKVLNICIKFPADSMLVLKQLQNILQLDTIDWTSISQLHIDVDYKESSCPDNMAGISDMSIVDFAQKLILRMPNVIGLHIVQHFKDLVFRQLLKLIVNAYSAQLRLLDMKPIINSPTTQLGSNLAYLTLRFDNDIFMKYTMSICAESLCELSLTNVPEEIPWHIFHGYSEPGQINFKSLQKLSILYNNYDVNNHPKAQLTHLSGSTDCTVSTGNANYTYKLLFPKLKVLDIRYCPSSVNYFNAKFGGKLKMFTLVGTLQSILQWVTVLQSTQKLDMLIYADKGLTATGTTNMLNKILDVTARYRYRILNLDYISAKLNLSSIAWGNVNELTVIEVDVTDILTLLSKTPRMEKLVVYSISIDNYNTIDQVEQQFQQRVETGQFALALKTLVIRCIYDKYDDDIALAVIYNLMTRAKSLSRIAVSEQFVSQMMMIIEAQNDYYPHFSKMHVFIDR